MSVRLSLAAALLMLLGAVQPGRADPFRDGTIEFQRGDFAAALRTWTEAAESGDPAAQHAIAQMYVVGRGVAQDFGAALLWSQAAAAQGFARAQYLLGVMYQQGQGMARDDVSALNWYRRAAAQGVAEAQYNLAGMYAAGRGAAQDYLSARMWYIVAAAAEDMVVWDPTIPYGEQLTLTQNFRAMALARKCRESNFQSCGEEAAAVAGAKF